MSRCISTDGFISTVISTYALPYIVSCLWSPSHQLMGWHRDIPFQISPRADMHCHVSPWADIHRHNNLWIGIHTHASPWSNMHSRISPQWADIHCHINPWALGWYTFVQISSWADIYCHISPWADIHWHTTPWADIYAVRSYQPMDSYALSWSEVSRWANMHCQNNQHLGWHTLLCQPMSLYTLYGYIVPTVSRVLHCTHARSDTRYYTVPIPTLQICIWKGCKTPSQSYKAILGRGARCTTSNLTNLYLGAVLHPVPTWQILDRVGRIVERVNR